MYTKCLSLESHLHNKRLEGEVLRRYTCLPSTGSSPSSVRFHTLTRSVCIICCSAVENPSIVRAAGLFWQVPASPHLSAVPKHAGFSSNIVSHRCLNLMSKPFGWCPHIKKAILNLTSAFGHTRSFIQVSYSEMYCYIVCLCVCVCLQVKWSGSPVEYSLEGEFPEMLFTINREGIIYLNAPLDRETQDQVKD